MVKSGLRRSMYFIKRKVTEYAEGFLSVLFYYEDICIICRDNTNNNDMICDSCKKKKRAIEKVIKNDGIQFKVNCCYYYGSGVGKAIKRIKYKSDLNAVTVFARDLKELILEQEMESCIVTFVPSEKSKYAKRGFNQSELLSRKTVEFLNQNERCDFKACKILEKKKCEDQIGLSRLERWRNVEDVFYVNDKYKKMLKNKKIILIDDVLTSGATAYYCSKRMIEAGAEEVVIMTIASANI